MSQTPNLVTQTNPFLNGSQKGLVPMSVGGSTTAATAPTSTSIQPSYNNGLLSQGNGGLSALVRAANGTQVTQPVPTGINFGNVGSSNNQGQANQAPASPAQPTSAPQQSVYQQNLSRYGLTSGSVPTGYSFDASGKLIMQVKSIKLRHRELEQEQELEQPLQLRLL